MTEKIFRVVAVRINEDLQELLNEVVKSPWNYDSVVTYKAEKDPLPLPRIILWRQKIKEED